MAKTDQLLENDTLKSAWQHYAEFDYNARLISRQHGWFRQAAIILAVVIVILAVFLGNHGAIIDLPSPIHGGLTILLIFILIVDFTVFGLAVRANERNSATEMRATAETIRKNIYLYRSVMQWHDECDQWLRDRLTETLRYITDSLGSNLSLAVYSGPLPPLSAATSAEDPGFTRLLPEDYLRYRINPQIKFYTRQLAAPKKNKDFLQIGLLVCGGLSLLLSALGGAFSTWIVAALFVAVALILWAEPRQLDSNINDYNQLIMGLNIIKDHWLSLSRQERTSEEFFKLVIATEKIIWSHYNKHASEVWHAIDQLQERRNDALDEMLLLPAIMSFTEQKAAAETADTPQELEIITAEIVSVAENGHAKEQGNTETALTLTDPINIESAQIYDQKGLPHAFVVMPFGRKQGSDGRWLDFDSIYYDLIRPALETAGFESFRADEESVSGDILTDMFQELLLADLVIADLSIDNANVFYELGVRHAMRKRGVVHIQSGRSYMPFDIFNVRTIPYHIDKNGRPDPQHLEKDRLAITKITRETWASDADRVHSPIFNLLDGLTEPNRRSLQTPLATGFWREYNEWRERVSIAQRQKRIGDILLLTEEISNPLIKEEAIAEAGRALQGMGRFELALQQYRHGLEINPRNISFRRQEAFHLNRMGRTDEAIVKLERLLTDDPDDIEAISYLGRIYKQMWMETWVDIEDDAVRHQEAYNSSHWLVKSINTYLEGYRLNQNNYYPGINALTGSVLMDFLAEKYGAADDPDIIAIRENLHRLKGAIHFALESTTMRDTTDYWALASLAELQVSITEDPEKVKRAYRKALTAARKNVYNLKSSLSQLELLKLLDFRPEYVRASVEVLQAEIKRIRYEDKSDDTSNPETPPQVFIFSGHRLDRPNQPEAHFPNGMEKEVREKIDKTLEKFNADRNDLAVTSGMEAGGEIIFLEACLNRGMNAEIHLPYEEARYIAEMVSYAGDKWVERFYALRNNPDVTIRLQADHLGAAKAGDNIYARNERWALYTSLVYGIDHTRLIALWDGKGTSHSRGGPERMLERVRQMGGIAEHLNTTKFDYWKSSGKVNRALDILAQEL